MTSQERQAAVLALVRRLLPLVQPDLPVHSPTHFTQLCDGIALFAMLRLVAPNSFPSTCSESTEEGAVVSLTGPMLEEDAQQRKHNMCALLRDIRAYAQEAMHTTSSTPVTQGLDPASLPRQEQVVLSDWVKEIMRAYQLQPRHHATAVSEPGPSGVSAHLRQTVSPQPASSGFAAASPMIRRGATGFSPSPLSHRGASSNAAAAGEEDEGYYRNATYQLRRELTEVKAQLAALQDAYKVSKEDKEMAEGKYRLLLGDQAKMSPTLAATSAAAATEGGDSEAGAGGSSDILSVWQRRCAQKDEAIAALTARVEQQSTQVTALKEATAAHEMALQALRRRLKTAEEGVMVKSEERREALQKLAVAEDKLAAQMKARVELETQVEELQSRLLVLELEQDRLHGLGSDDAAQLNTSFASNGSVDRVLALENELDEARQQRDSLQRQVGILQRQVAAMVAPVADVSTANDTWRAQLRQVEREREDLRQQLTTALERVGGLQQQLTASGAAAAVVDASGVGAGQAGPASGTANADASIMSVEEGSELDMGLLDEGTDSPCGRDTGLTPCSKTREPACREQTPTSVLTKQRRDVEQGLLETVLLGAKLRMMQVES
ncbi:hypothetical protein CGC21_35430 [Leishmania donovani]|uniref:Uncharacterized protein n=1 Tax=Leishmania donovani TaxID=5661 RepID=A0A504XDN2_LEIDO|nr:hypothetical protein CGC21_35430 [Leishmania donovani]